MLKNDNCGEKLMDDRDENIILFRAVFSGVSSVFCLFLIIVYFILCFQKKFNLCFKKEVQPPIEIHSDFENSSGSMLKKTQNNKKKSIGLGSNFMFLLTLSNFFGDIFEFMFYFYYKDKKEDLKEDYEEIYTSDENEVCMWNFIYKGFNDDELCKIFGFFHNFFDLFSVCWITMLTLLFYHSIKLSNEMLYKDKKYLIIGFIFSLGSCIIFCVLPSLSNSFGFARYYCSFRYNEVSENNKDEGEKNLNKMWRFLFVGITSLNNILNVILLYITNNFYSKKLKAIKNQSEKEYSIMLIYVWVFKIFPIVLIITRIFKGCSRIITEYFDNDKWEEIIQYMNSILFGCNGIFDSIACLFFFRGVFWCCFKSGPTSSSLTQQIDYSNIETLPEESRAEDIF